MQRALKKTFTPAEYLAMETVAEYKSEYYQGKIYALSGGTADHSIVAVNLVIALGQRLATTACQVFNSDMRLHVEASGLYTYPDVMVICDRVRFQMRRNDVVLNPVLIAEDLSQSTRTYDRGPKFNFYKAIPTLREYLLVDSEGPRVECYRKVDDDQWSLEVAEELDGQVSLGSVGCTIGVREMYTKVSWLT